MQMICEQIILKQGLMDVHWKHYRRELGAAHGGEEQALALHLEVSLFLSPILSLTCAAVASLVHRRENLTTSCTTAAANSILASYLLLQELPMMSGMHGSNIAPGSTSITVPLVIIIIGLVSGYFGSLAQILYGRVVIRRLIIVAQLGNVYWTWGAKNLRRLWNTLNFN
jgi:hypothetical protein